MYLLCKIVHHLKHIDVVHRDLKPANILVEKDDELVMGMSVKLIDFGLAKQKETDRTFAGSLLFMSPEAFKMQTDFSSDVWALGVIFYNMVSQTFPFEGDTHHEIYEAVAMEFLDFKPLSLWKEVPDDVWRVIKLMLDKLPNRRITIEKVLDHDCFKEIRELTYETQLYQPEVDKIQKFLSLPILSQSILTLFAKYLPYQETKVVGEKFLLLDQNNLGYLPMLKGKPKLEPQKDSNRKVSDATAAETLGMPKSKEEKAHNLTYSEFIAALVLDKDMVLDEIAELIIEDLSYDPQSGVLPVEDLLKCSIFKDHKDAIEQELSPLLSDEGITSEWLKGHIQGVLE